jgi:hypothetical protein
MAQETINIGSTPNDGTGDSLRVAGQKINNNFTQLFNVSPTNDTLARMRANAAFDAANTKVSKAGDTITGEIFFINNANNTTQNTKIGNIFDSTGIDVYAEGQNEFAQLNWSNSNFMIVDSQGVTAVTANSSTELKDQPDLLAYIVRINNNNWSFNSNGVITLFNASTGNSAIFAPGYRNTILIDSTRYDASNTDDIIFCDPNAAGANIVVNLSANVGIGKSFTIKNINPGGHSVNVTGTQRPFPYIEDPATGQFETRIIISNTGETRTWVFNSGVYRYIG